ncbi:MAG: hypothetical protein ACLGPL_11735 [Acidobacteriota bacterium]
MSIRMLAREYYQTKKQVEALEKMLAELPGRAPERGDLEMRVRVARAEELRLKKMIDGAKE